MSDKIGIIENFFSKVSVAVVHVTNGELRKGDKILIKGATTELEMSIDSMQIEHKEVDVVTAGNKVGLKVPERVRKGDEVYKV